jgi:hypothetical protein
MTEHEASRTLVKSPPELWAECSEAASLARHLGQFGEIRITRLEPETAVAWEGERASGTVRLEPSGWGTRVVLTARAASEDLASAGVEELEGVDELEPVRNPTGAGPVEGGDEQKRAGRVEEPAGCVEELEGVGEMMGPARTSVLEPASETVGDAEADVEVAPSRAPSPSPSRRAEPGPSLAPVRGGFFSWLFGRRGGKRAAARAGEAPAPVKSEAQVEREVRATAESVVPLEPEERVESLRPVGSALPNMSSAPPVEPDPEPHADPDPHVEPETSPDAHVEPDPRVEPDPEPAYETAPHGPAAPAPAPPLDPEAALTAALDSLGQAHHRPFSRA